MSVDMKINSTLIIQHRNKKAWSQQHLADICDLSLRTIQRAENTASASQETIKAIAAAFDTNVATLLLLDAVAVRKPRSLPAAVRVGIVSSTILAIIASLFFITPITSANEVLISSKEVQTNNNSNITEFKGDVKITIPASKMPEIRALKQWSAGETSFYEGEVTISIEGMTINLNACSVYKTHYGWAVTAGSAKLVPKETVS